MRTAPSRRFLRIGHTAASDECVIAVYTPTGDLVGYYTALFYTTGKPYYPTDPTDPHVLRYGSGQACGADLALLYARGMYAETCSARVREPVAS